MPELPEVEVVRAGLASHILATTITTVDVLHPRPVRRDPRGPAGFADALTGRRVEAARRRGKYLWLALDNGDALLGHLGMSGQLLLQHPGASDERHLRVRFTLRPAPALLIAEVAPFETPRPLRDGPDGPPADTASAPQDKQQPSRNLRQRDASSLEMRFVDQRMFGGLLVSAGGAVLPPEIAHIARDPLDDEFDDDLFGRRVRRRVSGIKRQLLDQTLISGVGNIYADEALWRAGIHGERPGTRLTKRQVADLLRHAREVMTAALGEGGTSFDALYVDVNGQSGYFDRSLDAYGREGLPCDRCGGPIRRVAFMNRSSYFCPRCQPVPHRSGRRIGV